MKVPPEIAPEGLIEDVRTLLAESGGFDRATRVQYRSGAEWLCICESGFLSLREERRVEALRLVTQQYADEVVMIAVHSNVGLGAYAHFVEGALVRFLAQCEEWHESSGLSEPWEKELGLDPGGVSDAVLFDLGDRLGLPSCAVVEQWWDIDVPIV